MYKKESRKNTIIVSAIVLILLFVPYVGDVLRTFNTFIHESGHAIAAFITGGKVDEIELYKNTEGVTSSYLSGNIVGIFVSLAGYVSSTLALIGMVWMIKKKKYNSLFYAITALSVINLVFWIRNLYGFVWILGLVVLLGYVIYKKKNWIDEILYAMTIIVAVAATKGVWDILYLSYQTPTEAGDASNLANYTMIPAIVWGVIFVVQHLVGLWITYKIMRKESKPKRKYGIK